MRVSTMFVTISLVSLAACNSSQPEPKPSAAVTATPTPLPTTIPAAFQGKWATTPDDCKAGSEGLLTVDADKLELGKSTATLGQVAEASATRFRGTFAFKGAETRTTDEVLDLQGDMLVRREIGEGATPKPFAYSRCG